MLARFCSMWHGAVNSAADCSSNAQIQEFNPFKVVATLEEGNGATVTLIRSEMAAGPDTYPGVTISLDTQKGSVEETN